VAYFLGHPAHMHYTVLSDYYDACKSNPSTLTGVPPTRTITSKIYAQATQKRKS